MSTMKYSSKKLLELWGLIFLILNFIGSFYIYFFTENGNRHPSIVPDWYKITVLLLAFFVFLPSILFIFCRARKEGSKLVALIATPLIVYLIIWMLGVLFLH